MLTLLVDEHLRNDYALTVDDWIEDQQQNRDNAHDGAHRQYGDSDDEPPLAERVDENGGHENDHDYGRVSVLLRGYRHIHKHCTYYSTSICLTCNSSPVSICSRWLEQ